MIFVGCHPTQHNKATLLPVIGYVKSGAKVSIIFEKHTKIKKNQFNTSFFFLKRGQEWSKMHIFAEN